MERLLLKFVDAKKAFQTFKEILQQPFSIIIRDASIQRFEYTFEALWKFCKEYLKEKEGVVAATPKSVFRELFALGILSEEQAEKFLDMTDKRNETSHTYKEAVAEAIYKELYDYGFLIEQLLEKCENRIEKNKGENL